MTQDEYDELLRRLAASAERHETQMEIAGERLGKAEETLRQMKQQLDRTDATHAGISATLVRMGVTMEKQTAVMQQLATTLDRWLERQANGH